MSAAYQRDYLVRLPLPLAQLYARAYNGKDARSRHQNTFYLFESAIKLAACTLVAAYRDELTRGGTRSAQLDQRVAKLALPSLGDWRDLVREGARHFGERPAPKRHPLTHVWSQLTEPRRNQAALLELYRRIKNGPDGQPGGDKSCSLMQVFDALVPYRNVVIGHGADRGDAFYDRDMGPRLFPAANELLAEGVFDLLGPSGTRLVYAHQVRVRDDHRLEIDLWDLVGLEGERAADVLLVEGESAGEVRPNQVSVLWPGYKLPLSIDPLLVFRDLGDRRELRFLNGDRNGKHVEYLSYTSGMIDRDASTVAALFELLRTVAGSRPLGERAPPRDERAPPEFEILGRLGKSSSGKVYLARQLSLGRLVALKTLAPELASEPLAVARFRREIETLARCDDSHIVKILSHGTLPDGKLYYAMEYVPGANLDVVLEELLSVGNTAPVAELSESIWSRAVAAATRKQQERLGQTGVQPLAESLQPADAVVQTGAAATKTPIPPFVYRLVTIARDAARALQAVHDQGLVHRDVKPGNLMVAPDGSRVVLMDFGLAKRQTQSLTQSWTLNEPRTSRYAAPEQLAGGNVQIGPAADVRGLGATFWELFARRRLFEDAGDEHQLAAWILHRDVPRLREIDPSIDSDLEAIVARATERSEESRIQTARELADYFDLYLADKPLPIRPPSAREVLARWARHNRGVLAAAVVSLLAIVVVTAVSFVLIVRERDAAVILAEQNEKLATAERLAHNEAEQKRAEAEEARDATRRQLRVSTALRLAAESQLARDEHPVRSALLAVEALRAGELAAGAPMPTVLQAVYDSLASIGGHPLTPPRAGLSCVAASADGHWLATTGDNNTVLLIDLTTTGTTKPTTLKTDDEKSVLLAFSGDGQWLAAAGSDRVVRLWNLPVTADANSPKLLSDHDDDLTAIAFSPAGNWLATAGTSGAIRLWPTSAPRPHARLLKGPPGAIRALAFSADSRRLAASGADEAAHLWQLGEGAASDGMVLRGLEALIDCLGFSPDGHWLATGSFDRTARLWDLTAADPAEGMLRLAAHTAAVTSLSFSPDTHWLATGGAEGTIHLWDLAASAPDENPAALAGHRSAVTHFAFSKDGQWLLSGGRDHRVCLWDTTEQGAARAVELRGHEQQIASLAFTADNQSIVTASADGVARRWRRDGSNLSAACVALADHADTVWSLAFSPDSRWLATASREKAVRLWNLESEDPAANPILLKGHSNNVRGLAFAPHGGLLATGSWDKTARLWRLDDADPSATSTALEGHSDEVSIVAFSDDGLWLVTAGWDKTARVWEIGSTGKAALTHVFSHSAAVTAAVFDHAGQRLATTSDDNLVRLWKLSAATKPATTFVAPTGGILTLAFTTDDACLIAAGAGGVYGWRLDAHESPAIDWLKVGQAVPIATAALSSDGGWLAVATHDEATCWKLADGKPSPHRYPLASSGNSDEPLAIAIDNGRLALSRGGFIELGQPSPIRLAGHDGSIISLAISRDGKWLAGGERDGTARLWRLTAADLKEVARRTAGRPLTPEEARTYQTNDGKGAATNRRAP